MNYVGIDIHLDEHNNVVALLDGASNGLEKYLYDAFGQPTIIGFWDRVPRSTSWYGNRFMFQGREYLQELGIYDYRHRMYHPGLGRFLQADPMGLQTERAKLTPEQKALYGAGAPEAFGSSEMNLFRYCGDDPVDRSDPLGLVPPGKGLMDVPRDTLEDMFQAGKQNSENAATRPSYDGPNGKPRKEEYGTAGYRVNGELKRWGPTMGYRDNGAPRVNFKLKEQPYGEQAKLEYLTHAHIQGTYKHYGVDEGVARQHHVLSGTTHMSDGGAIMHLFVPSEKGNGGQYFKTTDGRILLDMQGNVVTH